MKKVHARPSLATEAQGEVSEMSRPFKSTKQSWWSLRFRPLTWDEDVLDRPDLFRGAGWCGLRFVTSKYASDQRPYQFRFYEPAFAAMYPRRFYDWNDFVKRTKNDPRWEFIKKVCNLSEETFRIAKENYGTTIPFTFDVVKYKELCGGETKVTTAKEVEKYKTAKALRKQWKEQQRLLKEGRDPLTGKRIEE